MIGSVGVSLPVSYLPKQLDKERPSRPLCTMGMATSVDDKQRLRIAPQWAHNFPAELWLSEALIYNLDLGDVLSLSQVRRD